MNGDPEYRMPKFNYGHMSVDTWCRLLRKPIPKEGVGSHGYNLHYDDYILSVDIPEKQVTLYRDVGEPQYQHIGRMKPKWAGFAYKTGYEHNRKIRNSVRNLFAELPDDLDRLFKELDDKHKEFLISLEMNEEDYINA